MKRLTSVFALCLLLSTGALKAAAPARGESATGAQKQEEVKDYGDFNKFRFGGYGEMAASYMDYSFSRLGTNSVDNRGEISIPRFVLAFDYKFNPKWILGAEIEFEYGGTGTAREIEWYEENGEYEAEIEKGGEVALEQFHITRLINKYFNVRFGHMIVPIGLTNTHHEPINFFGVYRPEGETTILPSTWHETGVSFFGEIGRFDYEVQVVNGLDPQGFRSEDWISNGKQGAFEISNFTSPAIVARVNYNGKKGLRVGASFYYDQTAKNGSKPWRNVGYKFPVTIVTGDAQYISPDRNLIFRANAVYGNVGASGALTTINNGSSAASGYPNTTVAKNAVSYGGEIGYNIGSFFKKAPRIYPFVRYEYYNPMEKVEEGTGLLADKRFQVSAVTAGLNYYALPNLVVKADYTHRNVGGGKYEPENMVSVGIAYVGWFIKK